jgi:hypothetical protein
VETNSSGLFPSVALRHSGWRDALSYVLDRKRSPTFDCMDTAKVELQVIREIRLVTSAATVQMQIGY